MFRRNIIEKNQTKELIFSLKLILIGIFFWVIKVRYFTFFWLDEFHILNVFGLEIVGTILIGIGLIIIRRVYPFIYTMIAEFLIYFIFIVHILDFFLFKYKLYREIQQYLPFVMSLELILIAKLLESSLRYFGNRELSKRWKYLSFIIFFGFSLPFYLYISMKICGFIKFENYVNLPFYLLFIFLPIIITIIVCFIYYLRCLIQSFNYLIEIKNKN